MTAAQWRAALKAEGVTVTLEPGWETAGRDSATGKPFGPVVGVLIHHTVGTNSLAFVKRGNADLPGPLCHSLLAKSGMHHQISIHRANHAGSIAQNAYDAIRKESAVHPRPDTAEPIDGNDCLYGLEIENLGNGKDPYPAVQYDQAVRWAAAACRFHGWKADSVAGHGEVTRRKIDPSFSMDKFRDAVADRLKHPASWDGTDTTPRPAPARPQAYLDVVETDAIPAPRPVGENKYWTLETYVRYIAETQAKILARLEAIERKTDVL
jgi:hypothetical protein